MKTRPILFIFYWAFFGFSAQANTSSVYTFSGIWKLVHEHTSEIAAANHELESARIYEKRMSRHWYPRIFLEGRAYSTNAPALTFMSLLGQRQISSFDFSPQTLNQPGSGFFEFGTLGLDFPLYEGGSKTAIAESSAKMTEAKTFEKKSTEIQLYTDLAHFYSSILSLQNST